MGLSPPVWNRPAGPVQRIRPDLGTGSNPPCSHAFGRAPGVTTCTAPLTPVAPPLPTRCALRLVGTANMSASSDGVCSWPARSFSWRTRWLNSARGSLLDKAFPFVNDRPARETTYPAATCHREGIDMYFNRSPTLLDIDDS